MKALRITLVGILVTMFLTLSAQLMYVQIVKPWQIQRALDSGCKVIHSLGGKTISSAQMNAVGGAFSRAAWLDPRYLELVQASSLYAGAGHSASLSDLQLSSTYNGSFLVLGFCMNQYHTK
jgi:hypothetical protein